MLLNTSGARVAATSWLNLLDRFLRGIEQPTNSPSLSLFYDHIHLIRDLWRAPRPRFKFPGNPKVDLNCCNSNNATEPVPFPRSDWSAIGFIPRLFVHNSFSPTKFPFSDVHCSIGCISVSKWFQTWKCTCFAFLVFIYIKVYEVRTEVGKLFDVSVHPSIMFLMMFQMPKVQFPAYLAGIFSG